MNIVSIKDNNDNGYIIKDLKSLYLHILECHDTRTSFIRKIVITLLSITILDLGLKNYIKIGINLF